MKTNRKFAEWFPVLCTAAVLAVAPSLANGGELVPRWFAITPTSGATAPECPDLEGADSIGVVTGQPLNAGSITFADRPENILIDGDVVLDLRGTSWRFQPVMHVTKGGVKKYSAWWMENPPEGTATLSGPGGDVFLQFGVLIAQIDNGSDPDDGEYRVVTSGGSRLFCIHGGLFTR